MPRAVFAALPPGDVRKAAKLGKQPRDLLVLHEVHGAGVLPEPFEERVVDVGNHVHQGVFHPVQGMQR